jgi:hypothetical protein
MLYMTWQRFRNNWKYHFKEYLAVFFTCLALTCLIASAAIGLIQGSVAYSGVSTLMSIWSFGLFAIAYMLILVGNLQGTTLAYTGMLMYLFMTLFNLIETMFLNSLFSFNYLFSGDPVLIIVTLLILAFFATDFTGGIMTYIRTSQFLRNRYASYSGLRNWCLVFTIANSILFGLEPILFTIEHRNISLILLFLEPLGQVFISIAIFFTISRLKSEY